MAQSEIEEVRALLGSGRVGRAASAPRRSRLGLALAEDVTLAEVGLDGVAGEWSIIPGSDTSRVLMFFHGGGYRSGSIRSHRRMVTGTCG